MAEKVWALEDHPLPWVVKIYPRAVVSHPGVKFDEPFLILDAHGEEIADFGFGEYQLTADIELWQMMVACVNACADYPTKALEGGVLGQVITLSHEVNKQYPPPAYHQDEFWELLTRWSAALAKLEGGS